jgi:hypothetical protein
VVPRVHRRGPAFGDIWFGAFDANVTVSWSTYQLPLVALVHGGGSVGCYEGALLEDSSTLL